MASPPAMPVPYPLPTVRTEPERSSSGLMHTIKSNPLVSAIRDSYNSFHARREALGLIQPGRFDSMSQELSSMVFTDYERTVPGLYAELSNMVSPGFTIMQSLASGAEDVTPYSFSAMLQREKTFTRATYSTGPQNGLSAMLVQNWSKRWSSRCDVQSTRGTEGPTGEPMFSTVLSTDYTGDDFSATVKAENPSVGSRGLVGGLSLTYLQSVTPKLALGLDANYIRQDSMTAAIMAYGARYKGQDWIGSLTLTPFSVVNAGYYRRLSERCHAGLALDIKPSQSMAMFGASGLDATASFGTRYDFNSSTLRAKVDTDGKVGAFLESTIFQLPTALLRANIYAQIDHAKNTSKTGISFHIDSSTEEAAAAMEAQAMAAAAAAGGSTAPAAI